MPNNWYALRSKPRKEEIVWRQVLSQGFEVYYPRLRVHPVNPRSRKVKAYFPGYLFVRVEMDSQTHLEILKTNSVVRVLCNDDRPAPIPDKQIHAIQIMIKNGMAVTPYPYLKEGMKVLVVNGPLIGMEGILFKTKPNKHRLVLSLDLLKESVSVEIDESDVEPIHL